MDEVNSTKSCWGVTFWAVAVFSGAVLFANVLSAQPTATEIAVSR